MPRIDFDQLPDSSRVWIFGVDRTLESVEESRLLEVVDDFLEQWAAHGAPLTVARDWVHGRFLQVGLDESSVPPSGCSIDAMVHTLKGLEGELGVVMVDNAPVWFADEGRVHRVGRAEFRALAQAGRVEGDTTVFDNSVTRVGQVRAGQWERPARDSWHGKLLPGDEGAGARS